MSRTKVGHSALDAGAGVRGELAGLEDDPARERFLRAAIEHTAGQVALLKQQADDVADRAEAVKAAWDDKVAEAERICVEAEQALAAYEAELEDLVG